MKLTIQDLPNEAIINTYQKYHNKYIDKDKNEYCDITPNDLVIFLDELKKEAIKRGIQDQL